eukprot:scaffold5636_cov159-Ochromonas_danica.AAC.12
MLSKNERESKDLTEEKSLIYGEVEFSSFYRVLRKINPSAGQIFYDLGSGTGKALFVARLTQDFSKCIGIEILHSLHCQAERIVRRYQEQVAPLLSLGTSSYAHAYEGSFLDFDWSDGDLVFANSTCFGDDLMGSLSRQAEKLRPGAIVVTFTKGLSSSAFEVLERKRYRMSWGPATVFIHRRLGYDGRPVGPARLNILPSDAITYDDEMSSASAAPVAQSSPHNYDDDIDYDVRDYGNNEEEDEEDEEEEGDSEEVDTEGEEEEEEEEEESEEDEEDLKIAPPKPPTGYSSPSKGLPPPPSPQSKSSGSNSMRDSKASPAKSTGSWSGQAVKSTPPSISSRGAASKDSLSGDSGDGQGGAVPPDVAFSMLNSPLDEALLNRKRSLRKMPVSEEEGEEDN